MRILTASCALVVCFATTAAAQIPVGTRVGGSVSTGSYDSRGQRDPFISLVMARRSTASQPNLKPGQGLASLVLADTTVTGIVKAQKMMAILQGADRQSFVAKVGDHIADAVVKSIDARGVTFVDVVEPGRGNTPQETRKLLRSAAEVNR